MPEFCWPCGTTDSVDEDLVTDTLVTSSDLNIK